MIGETIGKPIPPGSIILIGDALESKDPVNLLQRYMAPIVLALPDETALSVLSFQAKVLFLTDQFSREILGNGFSGIYYNSVGCYCSEILSALEEIGAKTSAILLRDTFTPFPNSMPPVSDYERATIAESLGEQFESKLGLASDTFYSLVATHPGESKSESLWELSLAYMEKHKLVKVLA